MKVLYLGPECVRIEAHLRANHEVHREEKLISLPLLEHEKFDFCVSYRYKCIIPPAELSWFADRIINLHISLLPWNRGADPNIWSYLEDTPRGVSIHRIDAGIDTGPVLLQEEVEIDLQKATLESSWSLLSDTIEALFIANSEALLHGKLMASVQDKTKGSFHLSKDKNAFAYLWAERGWKTPVRLLLGKSKRRLSGLVGK